MIGLGEYHVVAGRVECEGQQGGCFAWVAQHPMCDPEAFMKAALEDNGWTQDSHVRCWLTEQTAWAVGPSTLCGSGKGRNRRC